MSKTPRIIAWFTVLVLVAPTLFADSVAAPKATAKAPRDDPQARAHFFLQKRGIVDGSRYPWEKILDAKRHNEKMLRYDSHAGKLVPPGAAAGISGWSFLGPSNQGGRLRSILFDPADSSTMYAGGVSGGVFKSTDGGANWTALTDTMANLAISCMAMDPSDSNVIYAGTGEGFYNVDAVRGAGIFKTTDAGATWNQLASTNNSDFYYVFDIVASASGSNSLYASTRTGVFRSTDYGATFTKVLNKSMCTDIAVRNDLNPDNVFASCEQSPVTFYVSQDGGATWPSFLTRSGTKRGAIAIAPSQQSWVYWLLAADSGSYKYALQELLLSYDGGFNWSINVTNSSPGEINKAILSYPVKCVPTCAAGGSCTGQGWYSLNVAVDPADPNRVWVGDIDLFRSDDAGLNWGQAATWRGGNRYVHADQHVIAFPPDYNGTTNKTMFAGCDGGLFKTTDARAATVTTPANICNTSSSYPWQEVNDGFATRQFYHGSVYPGGKTYFGGQQDNGTWRGTDSGGPSGWQEIGGGDGGFTAVNPTNTNQLFRSYTNGEIYRSDDGGANFYLKLNGNKSIFQFINPYIMDPNTPTRLWTIGTAPYRSDDSGDNWSQRGSYPVAAQGNAIAVAPGNSDLVVIGTTNGKVFKTTNGTAATPTWTEISTGLGGGPITWISFDPGDTNTMWVTDSWFGGPSVYRTTDGGTNWAQRDGTSPNNLPAIPFHTIVVHPTLSNRIYAASDLGVYVSTDSGATWMVENTGFPNVVVDCLTWSDHTANNTLYAFTHGRGAWRAGIADGIKPGENPKSGTDALKVMKETQGAPVTLKIDGGNCCKGSAWSPNMTWVNRLTPTGPFPVKLDQVTIRFSATWIAPGSAIDILVYTDPDGDGDPATGTTLAKRLSTTVLNDGWNTYTLTSPVTLASGDFYVGASRPYQSGVWPEIHEFVNPQSRSWWQSGDGSDPTWFALYTDRNYLIRARVIPAAAPGTLNVSWGNPCNSGTVPGQDFALYRGTLSTPWAFDHAGLDCAVGGTSKKFVESGNATYYIVVPRTLINEGSYSFSRPPAASACVPQDIGATCP